MRFHDWMKCSAKALEVDKKVFASLSGTVFEVRQGYKSKDSKRQNADIANATTAYTSGYFPCAVILSGQIDSDISLRYRSAKWSIVTGQPETEDPQVSTYGFMREVIGYDLAAFFERNSLTIKRETETLLHSLLNTE